jgi:hypothetical protein
MTWAHEVAKKKANQVDKAHARMREQSGAFEKFKTTATASLGQSLAARLKMLNNFMTSIFLKPI